MKKRDKQFSPSKEAEIGENLANPFADLKFDAPPPPEPPKPAPPPPPTQEELMEAELSEADKKLLTQFRQTEGTILSIGSTKGSKDSESVSGTVSFAIQKKGHKGKTVTLVYGLKNLSFEERMEIGSEIKTSLGIGARYLETTLELQGDQRIRAEKWFSDKGFKIKQ